LFDLDSLLGLPCQERVAHWQDESGNVSGNMDTVLAVKEQKVEKYGRRPVEGLLLSPLKIKEKCRTLRKMTIYQYDISEGFKRRILALEGFMNELERLLTPAACPAV
jgi:hypothetical protein